MARVLAALCLALLAAPAPACETALALTMDVSGSIDRGEYRIQTEGLAAALADPEVVEALIDDQVALSVIQWSGVGLQEVAIPWTLMRDPATVAGFAGAVRAMPRAFTASDTAIGDAIAFSIARFAEAPACNRRVIDVSGDGPENAGRNTLLSRREAELAGIIVNGLAIDEIGSPTTAFYSSYVVTRGGFVITARRHQDYARAIRDKLRRELEKPSS